jgi:23S rRNA U2552 (ribose-2'-O)-methylase RlmE/FtsJ
MTNSLDSLKLAPKLVLLAAAPGGWVLYSKICLGSTAFSVGLLEFSLNDFVETVDIFPSETSDNVFRDVKAFIPATMVS